MASRTTTDPIEILLEMGVDLDNLSSEEDYLSALMEAVNTLTIKDPTDPRIAPLQLEVRNVRKQRKAADPKFKEKKTKISVDNISTIKKQLKPVQSIPRTALVPYQSGKEEEEEQKQTDKQESKDTSLLANISKNVTDIADLLRQQYKQKQEAARSQRTQAEQAKRKAQESNLEKSFGFLEKAAEKIIAPVKSALSSLFDFFLNIFIGRFLVKFFDWFGDPKNQDKVTSLIRFFADHGLKLIAAFLLFGTGLGRLITGLVGKLIMGTGAILKFVATNPFAAGAALFGAGAIIPALFPDTVDAEEKKTKAAPGTKEEKLEKLREQKENLSFIDKLFGVDKEIDEQIEFIETGKTEQYSGGGEVSGPAGIDKVPAMLTDGEFVMSKGAVQKFGVRQLEAMNAAGGGTNRPKVVDNTLYASVGGYVGDKNKLGKRGTPDPSSELFSGFGGRTSQSENYSVRVINEIAKKVYNMINADRGGSPPPSSGERTPPPSSGPNIPGAGVAEEVYNRGKDFIGGVYDSVKPKIDAAMPQIQALPSTIDYGSLYLKSQLGGVGGAITEADLSQSTKDEYTRAYQVALTKLPQRRAGVESVIRQQQRILSNPGITEEQRKNAQGILNVNKSRLAKYDAGQVDVQYEDFQVDGKLTPTAAAAQKTMGAVWASDTGDGGFKIEKEPYDFPIVKDPIGLMNWKNLSEEEKYAWLDKQEPNLSVRKKLDPRPPYKGSLGKWGKQDIAEAMYSLNPAAAPMVTDVKIGGATRPEAIADAVLNTVESIPVFGTAVSFTRGLGMNLLFGKTRDVTKGPIEGAASDSIFRKLFPKQDKKEDSKATNIVPNRGAYDELTKRQQATPDKPKITAAQIKNNQAFAASKGKYYSSTTNKTYANYAAALKDPAVAAGAEKMQQKKESAMSMIMGGKDAYYSSTTGRYYKNYTEALKDPKVAAAAEVEKTKAKLSLAATPPKVTPPPPPSIEPKVTVVPAPAQQGSDSVPTGNGSGSEVDARPTGNGNANKFKIFGISLPF